MISSSPPDEHVIARMEDALLGTWGEHFELPLFAVDEDVELGDFIGLDTTGAVISTREAKGTPGCLVCRVISIEGEHVVVQQGY